MPRARSVTTPPKPTGPVIYFNEQTYEVHVRTPPNSGFLPDDELVAINLMVKDLRDTRDGFYDDVLIPKLKTLLGRITEWNAANNPEMASAAEVFKRDILKDEKPAKAKKKAAKKKTKRKAAGKKRKAAGKK